MKFTKTLTALALSGALAIGYWDFKDNTMEISRKSEISKLPIKSSFCQRADMNNNGLEDYVVAGPLVGEDKVAIYLLENKKTHYEPKLLHDEIPLKNASFELRDLNNDGLKDISIRGRTQIEKIRTHWKCFNLINKGAFYIQE